jgi:Ca-activated chloride channel homolog
MKIDTRLTFDKIRFDLDKEVHLVLSLTAPAPEEQARPTLCVVPVIDVSGSMAGDKLHYAKQSCLKLIDHLKPGDYCGLITFESQVRVVVKPQKITAESKQKIKAEVGKLHPMGGTNFSGGLLKALEEMKALDLPEGIIHRAILFTDGQANEGVATKPDDIIKLLSNSGRCSVSAFGYGTDVDQAFLENFSREGKGNYAFIQEPDSALAAFGKELGGLLSTYATDIVVDLKALANHEVTKVISDVDFDQEVVGGESTIKIPDIYSEEVRHIVLGVKLKEQKQAFPRPVNVFEAKLSYNTLVDGKNERKSAEVKVKAQFVKQGEEQDKPHESVDSLVALAQIVRAQIEAEEQVKKGNFIGAHDALQAASVDLQNRGRHQEAHTAGFLGGLYRVPGVYASTQGYTSSMRRGMSRGMSLSLGDSQASADLANLNVQVNNSVQTSTATQFTENADIPVVEPVIPVVTPEVPKVEPGVTWTTSLKASRSHRW